MSSLPLAVRTKADGDLVWFSEKDGGAPAKLAQVDSIKCSKAFRPDMFVDAYMHCRDVPGRPGWGLERDQFRGKVMFATADSFDLLSRLPALPVVTWSQASGLAGASFHKGQSGLESGDPFSVIRDWHDLARAFVPTERPRAQTSFSPLAFVTAVQQPQHETIEEFLASEQLIQILLSCQADGEQRNVERADRAQLQREVSERVVDAIADIGYRWVERGRGANKVVSFNAGGSVDWCDEELAKLLVYELNVSIVSASRVFDQLFGDVCRWVGSSRLSGDWGQLVRDGAFLTLLPAQE